jgi:glycosyltransferase involved in cell wall biosynthesis
MSGMGGSDGGRTIGFVLHSAKRDGANLAFLELADGLAATGLRPVATVPSDGPMRGELLRRGIPVSPVWYRWWLDRGTPVWKRAGRSAWNVAMAFPLALRLRRLGADVVVTNTLTVVSGAVAARVLGLRHVWHVHELWGGETGFEFDLGAGRSLRLVDRLSAACVAASSTVRARLVAAGVDAAKVRVVTQSVTLTAGRGASPSRDESALVCVLVGSLIPLKRQTDAIRAVAELTRRGTPCELWLVGGESGGYADELRERAAASGGRVRFFGAVEDPAPIVRAADVVLSCSAVEGFGRTIVEGMLLGRTVVAAAGGAGAELIVDGVTGLTYPPGDIAALALGLERLARDRDERSRLGEAAARHAASAFTRPRYAAEMAALLEPLLRPASR